MNPMPEDAGSFLAIRTANPQMLYVDKAAYLHRLPTSGRPCVFPARPRRHVEDAKGVRSATWRNHGKMKLVPDEVAL